MDLEDQNNFHVLAVDDSLLDRKVLEKLLTVSSCHVTCVDSGNMALEYLGLLENRSSNSSALASSVSRQQEKKVNLIMTDYSMPGMTGFDLLQSLKRSSLRDIPVVVMSSENDLSRINMCLEGGAEGFLLKPVQLSDINKLQPHFIKSLDPNCKETDNLSCVSDISKSNRVY